MVLEIDTGNALVVMWLVGFLMGFLATMFFVGMYTDDRA